MVFPATIAAVAGVVAGGYKLESEPLRKWWGMNCSE